MELEPITREEMYLAAAAGYSVTPPEPITRKEFFLANLAGMNVETPSAYTRQERFLEMAAVTQSACVIEPGVYWKVGNMTFPNSYYQRWFTFNGTLYALTLTNTGTSPADNVSIYRWTGSAWSLVVTTGSLGAYLGFHRMSSVEYDGKIHFMGNEMAYHYTFDGTTVTKLNDCTNRVADNALFVSSGSLKAYSFYDGIVYVWNSASDSWTAEATIGSKYVYYRFASVGNVAYTIYSSVLYKYENNALTKVADLPGSIASSSILAYGTKLYWNYNYNFYKTDVTTLVTTSMGQIPINGDGCNLTVIDGEIHLIACDNKYRTNLIMYEVTE